MPESKILNSNERFQAENVDIDISHISSALDCPNTPQEIDIVNNAIETEALPSVTDISLFIDINESDHENLFKELTAVNRSKALKLSASVIQYLWS